MSFSRLATNLAADCANVLSGAGALPAPSDILGANYFCDWDLAHPGVVLADGSTTVASIPNKGSDTSAVVIAPASNRATWEAAGFDGAPSALFNGSTQGMAGTFATPIPIGSRLYAWVVAQPTALAAGSGVAFTVASLTGARVALYYSFNVGPAALVLFDAAAAPYATGNPIAAFDTARHLYEIGNVAGGVGAYALDGVTGNLSALSCAVTDTAFTQFHFTGYGFTADQRAAVRFARVIIANAEPTPAQRTAMRAYFKRSYPSLPL